MAKSIELVVDFETLETKEFFQPQHLKGSVTLEALTIGQKLDKVGTNLEVKDLKEVAAFVANKLYNGQFTDEELIDGIHAYELIDVLMEQLTSVLGAESENFTKAKKA